MKVSIQPGGSIFTLFVLRLLMVLFFIEFVKGALLVTVLPVYMNTFLGMSAYTIGWALALQYAGDNLCRTPMGWVVDRIGYRTGIVVGVLVTGLSIWIMATADTGVWMIVAAALLGIGTSPLWPSVIAGATAEAGEHARGTVMSVVYVAWISGTGLGPVVINLFISGSSYRPAFWLLSGILLIVLAVSLFLPGKKASRREHSAQKTAVLHQGENVHSGNESLDSSMGSSMGSSVKVPVPGSIWTRFVSYIAKVRSTIHVSRLFYPALFMQNATIGLLAPVMTLYAKQVLHLTNTMYSIFLIFGGGITILLLYPAGKLVDRFGTKWMLHIGFLLGSGSIIMFSMTHTMSLIWVIVALIGISFALIIPAWNAFIGSHVPSNRRALVWGFFLTIEGGGMVAGSIISGRLWDTYGPQAPFIASGFVLLTLFVLHLFISKPLRIVIR